MKVLVLMLALAGAPELGPTLTATGAADYRLAYVDARAAVRIERAGRLAAEAERDAAEVERDAAHRIAATRKVEVVAETDWTLTGWVAFGAAVIGAAVGAFAATR